MKSFNEWLATKDPECLNEVFGLFDRTPKPEWIYDVQRFLRDVEGELGDDFVPTHSVSSARAQNVKDVVIEAYNDMFSQTGHYNPAGGWEYGYGNELKAMFGDEGRSRYGMFTGNAKNHKDPKSLQRLIFAIGKFEGEEHSREASQIREKLVKDLVTKIKAKHNIEGKKLGKLGRPNARNVSGGEYDDDSRYVTADDMRRIRKRRYMS